MVQRRPALTTILTFLSFTNRGVPNFPRRVKYETFAAFQLTNQSPEQVSFSAAAVEVWAPSGWQTNQLRATPTNWLKFGGRLLPHESSVFYVSPPTNSKWRIRLKVQEHAAGWKRYRDRLDDYLANLGSTVKRETFSGCTYELLSPEVSER